MQYSDYAEEEREERVMRRRNICKKFMALLMAMAVMSNTISSSLMFAEESDTETSEAVAVTEGEAAVEEQELPEISIEDPENIESIPVESEVIPVETERVTEQTESPASESDAVAEREEESNEGTEAVAIESGEGAGETSSTDPVETDTEALSETELETEAVFETEETKPDFVESVVFLCEEFEKLYTRVILKAEDFFTGSEILKAETFKDDSLETVLNDLKEKTEGDFEVVLPIRLSLYNNNVEIKDFTKKVTVKIYINSDVKEILGNHNIVLYHQNRKTLSWDPLDYKVSVERDNSGKDESFVEFETLEMGTFLLLNRVEDAETDGEEETEIETESETSQVEEKLYTFEDDSVFVEAYVKPEAGFSEEVEFKAEALEEGSREYIDAVSKVEEYLNLQEGETLRFIPYDVYFMDNGTRIEPDSGTVRVKMFFKNREKQENINVKDSFVAHIKDDGEVERLENFSEENVEFETSSFSVMGLAEVVALSNETEAAYAILYNSGELVFQRGGTPDESKGTVLGSYTGFETATYGAVNNIPWKSNMSIIKSVSFKDTISPVSCANWFNGASNLAAFDGTNLDTSNTTSFRTTFINCSSMTSFDNVSGWDMSKVEDTYKMFSGCGSLERLDGSNWNLVNVKDTNNMFLDCKKLQYIESESWNLSKVTNASYMFRNCNALVSVDTSNFDMSSCTNCDRMFGNCWALSDIDVSEWKMNAVKKTDFMFYDCRNLNNLNTEKWVLNNVESAPSMFYNCKSLTNLQTSSWSLMNCENTSQMFNNCSTLTDIGDTYGWNLSKVTSVQGMFWHCSALNSLNTSNWDMGSCTDFTQMFSLCNALSDIDVSGWRMDNATKTMNMFYDCDNIRTLNTRNWVLNNVTTAEGMFYSCNNLVNLYTDSWGLSACTNTKNMFYSCSVLSDIDTSGWYLSNVTTAEGMFWICATLTSIDASNWGMGSCTNINSMFRNCSDLQKVDTEGWDLSKVTTANSAFYNNVNLVDLGDDDWNFSVLKTCPSMFSGCSNLTDINTLNWDLSNVTDAQEMFKNCSSLSELETGDWNLSNAVTLSGFLNGCSGLKTIDATNWGLNKAEKVDYMFAKCSGLESIGGTENWNLSNVKYASSMLSGCSALTELSPANWKFSAVTSVSNLFNNCSSLQVLDMSSWDLTKATGNMSDLFRGCGSLVKFVVGEKFRFSSSVALPFDSWIRVSNQQVYSKNELYTSYDGATMADTYCQTIVFQFHGNGGLPTLRTKEGYFDMTIDELPEASKTGAYFAGWFTEANGGTQLNVGDPLTSAEYYAHWNNYKYTLILKSLNESGDELPILLDYDECYKLSDSIFTNDGMVLTGWNTRKNGSGTSYEANEEVLQLSEEDGGTVTLYAQWRDAAEVVTVTFDSQEGSEVSPKRIVKGTAIGNLPQSKRDGYSFEAWHVGSADGPAATEDMVVSEDTTLYAAWVKNPLVTFDGNGVVDDTTRSVKYGFKIGDLPIYNPAEGRYQVLIGWFTEPVGGEQITANKIITEDVTYYAHWGWQPLFNANGGHVVSSDVYPVQDSSDYLLSTLPAAVKDGYRFDGWFLPDGTEVHAGDTVNLANGSEISAHWRPENVVIIDFDPNGGKLNGKTGTTSLNAYKDKVILSVYMPERDGYEFCGWADKAGNFYTDESSFEDDIVLYAQWKQKDCTVTFVPGTDADMDPSSKVVSVPSGSTINTIPGARKISYILDGWYTEKNGQGEKLTDSTVISSDVTYYAYYKPFVESVNDEDIVFTYGVEWSNASDSNVDNVNGNLEFHPENGEDQVSSLHIRFELNNAIGDTVVPKEAVKIKIPKYIWKDWDGNNTGSDNISALLPLYPEIRSGMYFSYYEEGDSYVLINNQDLLGGAGVDITVSYSVSPWNVKGGATDVNGRYVDGYDFYSGEVPVVLTIDKELDGKAEVQKEDVLSVEMHTADVADAKKVFSSVSYKWDEKWGTKQDDADKYFYVTWKIGQFWYSSSNQPFTFEWSEDTVHDGTVIGWSDNGKDWSNTPLSGSYLDTEPRRSNWIYSYIVTKHPMSLLENVPEDGLDLYNEAVLIENWKSGYKTSQRVNATATVWGITVSDKGDNFLKKKPDKYGGNGIGRINGGQETLIDDTASVDMAWEINYKGDIRDNPVVWDPDTNTYVAEKRTIRIRDGVAGDLVYSTGNTSNKYKWEPLTGNINLSDEDYHFYRLDIRLTESDIRQENGTWTDSYVHENTDDYDSVDIYVRYKNTSAFVFYKELYAAGAGSMISCILPGDVTGFEIRHNSEFYETDLNVVCYMELKSTQKIRALVQSDIDKNTVSLFKNRCVCDIWDTSEGEAQPYYHAANGEDGNAYAYKELYELNISETTQNTRKYVASQENVIFDAGIGTQDDPVYIKAWNYNNSGRKKAITSGVLYDLLPRGTSVDVNSVFGTPVTNNDANGSDLSGQYNSYKNAGNKLEAGMYDVSFVSNWEESGRTMMIIKFSLPSDLNAVGVNFWYLLHNTYENVLQNGLTVENDVAFVNTTKGAVVPADLSYDKSVIAEAGWFDSLASENEEFISFAEDSTHYIPVGAFSWAFDKSVKTLTEYETSSETTLNSEYTYRLSYSQSDDASAKNIVFYDILENGAWRTEDGNTEFKPSEWQGILKNVDVTSISEKLTYNSSTVHCKPVVYYSTKPRAEITEYDVSDSSVWTTDKPSDMSTVTAIAVDCSKNEDGSDYVAKYRQVLEVYVTMQAPCEGELAGKTAYNESIVYTQKTGDLSSTSESSDCDVTLVSIEPDIHKTSNPSSGTQSNPKTVAEDESLDYTISIKNSDSKFSLYNVIVEDVVPDGLAIDTSNISVRLNDGSEVKVSDSPRVSLQKTGQKLTFSISSLLPNETMSIVVPTVVSTDTGLLENTAVITRINGIEKDLKSETTYHEAKPVSESDGKNLKVTKTVEGNMGNKSKGFHFKLKLSLAEGNIPDTVEVMKGGVSESLTVVDHAVEFTLSHNETAEFIKLPVGLTYEVAELDGESDGYTVNSSNASGVIGNEDVVVSFTNTKNMAVPTSADFSGGLFFAVSMLLAFFAGLILKIRKHSLLPPEA